MPRIVLTEKMIKALGGTVNEAKDNYTFELDPGASHPTHSTYLSFRHAVRKNGIHIGSVDYDGFRDKHDPKGRLDTNHPAYHAFRTRV